MPDTIQFKYGNQILNRYAADGRKLYTEYLTKTTQLTTPIDTGAVFNWVFNRNLMTQSGTDYIGNIEYRTSLTTTGKQYFLQRVHNPEGYSNMFSDLYVSTNYFYLRRDHLGNTREVWLAPYTVYAAGNFVTPGSVVQRTQYYPSGLPWAEGLAPDAQPYKYNGKEFIEMHGYDMSDYGWRGLQNATMRFNTVDPMAEKYYSWSPYQYVRNNPILRIDPNGMWDELYLTGDEVREAFRQLQSASKLKLSMADNGKVSATGEAKTESDKQLKAAIDDPDKVVKLNATSSYTVGENGLLVVGAYQGSHCEGDLTVGEQSVNMEQAKKIEDNGGAKVSATVLHEGLESYAAMNIGTGVHDANTEAGQQVYKQAHDATMKLPAAASDQNIFKDEGKAYPGYDTYFHQNPTTGKSVILFMYKNTPNK